MHFILYPVTDSAYEIHQCFMFVEFHLFLLPIAMNSLIVLRASLSKLLAPGASQSSSCSDRSTYDFGGTVCQCGCICSEVGLRTRWKSTLCLQSQSSHHNYSVLNEYMGKTFHASLRNLDVLYVVEGVFVYSPTFITMTKPHLHEYMSCSTERSDERPAFCSNTLPRSCIWAETSLRPSSSSSCQQSS